MQIIEIQELENGAHRNQTIDREIPVPEGWAVFPEHFGAASELENFPFGRIAAADRNGTMTVTSWTPGEVPEAPEGPEEPPPSQEARLAALEAETAAIAAAIEQGLNL